MVTIEKRILSKDFCYNPPYFYNNNLALRCELGIGDSDEEYMANAKNRAAIIYSILFEKGVDMFFFDNYISDWDFDMGDTVYIGNLISTEKKRLKFSLGYQNRFNHKIVRDIPLGEGDDDTDIIRRNRICCYPDRRFNAIDVINAQIDSQLNPTVHLVSFENSCILSVYDDRGCDIVFFDKSKFRKFYPLLQKYFLDWNRVLMEQRLNNSQDQ